MLPLHRPLITPRPVNSPTTTFPTTPHAQRLSAITHARFGLLRFRSPLLTESRLFSLPAGTEMFHFPAFPHTTLYIQAAVASDSPLVPFEVSPFGHPRITARLPTPRGLSQVTTSFIGSWCLGIHRSHLVACHTTINYKDARVHYEVLKPRAEPNTQPPQQQPDTRPHEKPQPALQDPTVCLTITTTIPVLPTPHPTKEHGCTRTRTPAPTTQSMIHNHSQPTSTTSTETTPTPTLADNGPSHDQPAAPSHRLLRKEVIQPHLPVRLPCYDLVLITSPTFDGSPHKG